MIAASPFKTRAQRDGNRTPKREALMQAALLDDVATVPGTGLDRLRSFLCRTARINMAPYGRCVIRTGDRAFSPEIAMRFRGLL